MIERELSRLILTAVRSAAPELGIEDLPEAVEVVRPRQKEHGDYATNVALALGASAGRNPREVAEVVVRSLPPNDVVAKAEVAGPGFINLFLSHGWLYGVLGEVERLRDAYGRSDVGRGERVQVEFVSANPTGPLHVGSGRNAALGDSLSRILEASGYHVEREYYVNDAGTQAELFGASLEARYLQRYGRDAEIPEGGYEGAYLAGIAGRVVDDVGDSLLGAPPEERRSRLRDDGVRHMLASIEATLSRMRVRIDRWVHQSQLLADGLVDQAVRLLRDRDLAYEADGAVWFRAERFGDEKDRVLVRSNGEPTYFAADCAYLREKFARGFDRLVYVWGADHHGTVRRLQGAVRAMGYDLDRVEFIVYQLVNLYRGGDPVRMSKRTGEIVTLDEVIDEVGPDAARYTLLSRSPDTTLDFDLEAVRRQSLDNPVYYVQYAHARIASLLRYAEEQGAPMAPLKDVRPEELVHETELDLLRKIAELPEQVELAARL
ncbi:MAG TPA: arginine--tRNA ligase, partial [Actinomycetota bacterium]|nr:arginine--tRNA ligase [Actinomycetota bacterium]